MRINQDAVKAAKSATSLVKRSGFVNASVITDALERSAIMAFSTDGQGKPRHLKSNLLLWGPGGYGKSDIPTIWIKRFAEKMALTTSKMDFTSSTQFADVLGGEDIKSYVEERKKGFLWEQSPFFTGDIVHCEELLDPAPPTITAMKEMLTSGTAEVSVGVHKPIKAKWIVAMTNVNPNAWATDDSREALISRFGLHHVSWNGLSNSDYEDGMSAILSLIDGEPNSDHAMIPTYMRSIIAEFSRKFLWSPRKMQAYCTDLIAEAAVSGNEVVSEQNFKIVADKYGLDSATSTKTIIENKQRESARALATGFEVIMQGFRSEHERLMNAPLASGFTNEEARRITAAINQMNAVGEKIQSQLTNRKLEELLWGSPEYGDFGKQAAEAMQAELAEMMDAQEDKVNALRASLVDAVTNKLGEGITSGPYTRG